MSKTEVNFGVIGAGGIAFRKTIPSMRKARNCRLVAVMNPSNIDDIAAEDLLEDGYDIRTVQELLGHKDVSTTMRYTHIVDRGPFGFTGPADSLDLGTE